MSIIHLEQPGATVSEPGDSPKTIAASADNGGNLTVTQGTALSHNIDSIATVDKVSYVNLSASALIATGTGNLHGIVVNSHSSGTLKFWDNTSAATTVLLETITLAAGERWIPFFGIGFGTGLFLTIGGTANVTVAYTTNA